MSAEMTGCIRRMRAVTPAGSRPMPTALSPWPITWQTRPIAIKHGPDGALIATEAGLEAVPVPSRITPLDTTAAGDSFNAGYLAARASGLDAAEAAHLGHRLAGIVIGHRGAIVPREATSGLSPAPSPAPHSSRDAP